jgi:hypothetical protein
MKWGGKREPCSGRTWVCSGSTWHYAMRLRHRNVEPREKAPVSSALYTSYTSSLVLRSSWNLQPMTQHVRPQDGWIMRILSYRSGHKGTVLSKVSGALGGHAVILDNFVLPWPPCPLCPQSPTHSHRITQWRNSSARPCMARSLWSLGFCYLRLNTIREWPKMHSEDE